MQRYLLLPAFLLFMSTGSLTARAAGSGISDSIDIVHTLVELNITDYAGKTIQGKASLTIQAKVDGIVLIPLDLLALSVDSVHQNGLSVVWSQVGEQLLIETPAALNTGDEALLEIWYGGEPDKDALWGGWYWSGDYAYQMGVGFVADPHNFGRVWFPCFDNFIERTTLDCHITVPAGFKAFCGGILVNQQTNADGTTTWFWELHQPIPSYLASVAVYPYATLSWMYEGMVEDIPVELGVKPADTTKLLNSFIHLNQAIQAFEESYGPYQWDRVGYVVVPFSGGAMEHACNIAYPSFAVDGNTTWESLMAHELAHSWWGNLVTCSDASEMWLNEGWASFSEHLFLEKIYGRSAYEDAVNEQHLDVINYGYAYDGNVYQPLSAVTHDLTYGYTTYTRGALTIHNLRGYMGDEAFFNCISSFLETYAFQPVSSESFRDHLTACSSIDMNPFFDGWIFNAGTPAWEINKVEGTANPTICLQQKLNHAPDYFQQYPVNIFLVDEQGNTLYTEFFRLDAPEAVVTLSPDVTLPDNYQVILDRNNLVADAVTADELWITETGEYELDFTKITLEVESLQSDTDWMRIEHYWVGADAFKSTVTGLHTNSQRYWRVLGGYQESGVSAVIRFNGVYTTSGGYLDNEFISNSDDSLVLLYRSRPQDEWTVYPYYTLDPWGNKTDGRGEFELSQWLKGEYTFGIYNHAIPNADPDTSLCLTQQTGDEKVGIPWKVFPNPTDGIIQVQTTPDHMGYSLQIVDAKGTVVQEKLIDQAFTTFELSKISKSYYMVVLISPDRRLVGAQKVLIIP